MTCGIDGVKPPRRRGYLNPGGDPIMNRDVVEKYSRLAERYDRRWSRYIEATTRETLRRLAAAGFRRVRVEKYKIGRLWGMMTAVAESPQRTGDRETD